MPSDRDVRMVRPHLTKLPDIRPLAPRFHLRPLVGSDDDALAALLTAAFGETWSVKSTQEELTQNDSVKACYGVFDGDRLVATASSQLRSEYSDEAGFLHWVGTHPDYRRQGLAATIVRRVLDDFNDRGYKRAALITQAERKPAIRVYLGFGFVPDYTFAGADQHSVWSEIFQELA